jgi:hypothetical protein
MTDFLYRLTREALPRIALAVVLSLTVTLLWLISQT